jgi:hypothetical protein
MIIQETKKAVEKFKHDNDELARNFFKDNGSLPMMMTMLIEKDGKFEQTIVDGLYEVHGIDKQLFVRIVSDIIESEKPIAMGLLSEAWMVESPKDGVIPDKRVSEMDDKVEILSITTETYYSSNLKIYKILRDGDQVDLEMKVDHEDVGKTNIMGTFTNLLKKNYDKFYNKLDETLNNSLN